MLRVTHSYGFFSNCSVRLDAIVRHFNTTKTLPEQVDSTQQFEWYKPEGVPDDITFQYFQHYSTISIDPSPVPVDYHHSHQFMDYKKLQYDRISPFVTKFFTPSDDIIRRVEYLEQKYHVTNYEKTCALFYRGNDKVQETRLCDYDDIIIRAERLRDAHPTIRFLVQSDESEFIDTMLHRFPNSFCFKDEIRHMQKQLATVDHVFHHLNHEYSKYYLAITLIMARCNHIICTSGNCSIWIMLFRGHANNVQQFLDNAWL